MPISENADNQWSKCISQKLEKDKELNTNGKETVQIRVEIKKIEKRYKLRKTQSQKLDLWKD